MCFKLFGGGLPDPEKQPDLTDNSIISIACGNFPGTANDLKGPPHDQVDFEKEIKSWFPQYVYRKFLDKHATCSRFMSELRPVVARMNSGDLLLFIMDTCYSETNTRDVLPKIAIQSRVYHNPKYPVHQKRINKEFSPGSDGLNYVSMSACRDHETAADAYFNHRANGAYSYALMHTMEKGITYREWDIRAGTMLQSLGFPQHCTIEGPDELIDRNIFEGTVYCIYISSHGSHIYDISGDEPDSQDEGPYFYDGMLIDDNIREVLEGLPSLT